MGINPPALTPYPPLTDSNPEQPPAQKSPPLATWHYDPQLFRKWPQIQSAPKEERDMQQDMDVAN